MLSQGPTGSAPGTASVYKMRLRADPHRSQITYLTKAERWPRELKVNFPSGYDKVNLIWSSRG